MTKKNTELNLLFSTPIWTILLADYKKINKIMFKYIKQLQRENPKGITRSNLFGWHSKDFDLNNNASIFFRCYVVNCINL